MILIIRKMHIYSTDKQVIQKCYNQLNNDLVIRELKIDNTNEKKFNAFITEEQTNLIWTGNKSTTGYTAINVERDDKTKFYTLCGFKGKVDSAFQKLLDYLKK